MIFLLTLFIITLNLLFNFNNNNILYDYRYLLYIPMLWLIFIKFSSKYLVTVYIDNINKCSIILNFIIPKKSIRVNVEDINKIIVQKDLIRLHYTNKGNGRHVSIPKTLGMDRNDLKALMGFLKDIKIQYKNTTKLDLSTQKLVLKIVNIVLIVSETLALFLLYGYYKGWG